MLKILIEDESNTVWLLLIYYYDTKTDTTKFLVSGPFVYNSQI